MEDQIKENIITIWKDEDGNWRGTTRKWGKLITAREAKPEDVLFKLLHSDGEQN